MGFFAPRISADTKRFWEGCAAHRLLVQKCKKCGKLRWPAGYLCSNCMSEETELVELSGEGTLYSFTVFQKNFHPSLAEEIPYIVCEVDLEGGIRLVSNLISIKSRNPRCGAKVHLKWLDCEGYSKPVFELTR